jgi:hypothetical protein
MGSGTWNRYAFGWEDGSPAPALNPSGQNYQGPGYSHWSVYQPPGATSNNSPDPNNAGNTNQQCVAATTTHVAFSYYAGPLTSTGRKLFSNYIKDANTSANPIGWNDRPCGETYPYICELIGRWLGPSGAAPGCALWLGSCRLAWQCFQPARPTTPT